MEGQVTTTGAPLLNPRYLAAAVGAIGVMIAAVAGSSLWFLNFVHVFSGLLWTGIDLFMGFMIGPILRRVDLAARRQIIARLMPRMLFLMPTLAINTGTAGWFLAVRLGFMRLPYPQFAWVAAALVIITLLTIQGLGLLLPTNVKVYLELRKAQPDGQRIARLMRVYVFGVATQGLMQILIIVVMARFAVGLV